MVDLTDFINYLNSSINENFPNTSKYIVNGSDSIKDIIMELREDNKVLRYSPYKLFTESLTMRIL